MTASNRLLEPGRLPKTLWDSEKKILMLPKAFSQAYEKLIDRYALRELVISRTIEDSPVGGLDKPATDKHFAQQFDNSAARAQLAITNATSEEKTSKSEKGRDNNGNQVIVFKKPFSDSKTITIIGTIYPNTGSNYRFEEVIQKIIESLK